MATEPAERATRQVRLQQAEADFDPLPLDVAAARTFGRVAVSLHRAGRKTGVRSYDAMIAAVALANDEARRRTLRTGMRERLAASALLDHAGFTRKLEQVYRDYFAGITGSKIYEALSPPA